MVATVADSVGGGIGGIDVGRRGSEGAAAPPSLSMLGGMDAAAKFVDVAATSWCA